LFSETNFCNQKICFFFLFLLELLLRITYSCFESFLIQLQ